MISTDVKHKFNIQHMISNVLFSSFVFYKHGIKISTIPVEDWRLKIYTRFIYLHFMKTS